jgi:hypothetical protein
VRRTTIERIDRTKERNKTDTRATTCNPFERNFDNLLNYRSNVHHHSSSDLGEGSSIDLGLRGRGGEYFIQLYHES